MERLYKTTLAAVAMVVMLVMSSMAFRNTEVVYAQNVKQAIGDVNCDGSVNTDDAVRVLHYYGETMLNVDHKLEIDLRIGDATGDQKIDTKDATEILKCYASRTIMLEEYYMPAESPIPYGTVLTYIGKEAWFCYPEPKTVSSMGTFTEGTTFKVVKFCGEGWYEIVLNEYHAFVNIPEKEIGKTFVEVISETTTTTMSTTTTTTSSTTTTTMPKTTTSSTTSTTTTTTTVTATTVTTTTITTTIPATTTTSTEKFFNSGDYVQVNKRTFSLYDDNGTVVKWLIEGDIVKICQYLYGDNEGQEYLVQILKYHAPMYDDFDMETQLHMYVQNVRIGELEKVESISETTTTSMSKTTTSSTTSNTTTTTATTTTNVEEQGSTPTEPQKSFPFQVNDNVMFIGNSWNLLDSAGEKIGRLKSWDTFQIDEIIYQGDDGGYFYKVRVEGDNDFETVYIYIPNEQYFVLIKRIGT